MSSGTLLQCLPLVCSGSAVHEIARKGNVTSMVTFLLTTSPSTRTSTLQLVCQACNTQGYLRSSSNCKSYIMGLYKFGSASEGKAL